MTKNQIEYWKLEEDKRSNRAQETQRGLEFQETQRSNLARETETHRANAANELLTGARDAETKRANLAKEAENIRANQARELETNRANLASEAEAKRSHQAQEFENRRSNSAREYETARSNYANELITQEFNRNTNSLKSRELNIREGQLTLDREKLETDRAKHEDTMELKYQELATNTEFRKAELELQQAAMRLQELLNASNIDLNETRTWKLKFDAALDSVNTYFKYSGLPSLRPTNYFSQQDLDRIIRSHYGNVPYSNAPRLP